MFFQSDREGDLAMFRQPADGSRPAERVSRPERDAAHEPESASPDGMYISLNVVAKINQGVWVLKPGADPPLTPLVDTPAVEKHSAFSPDGRWIAYMATNVSPGAPQVFVQPFPPTGVAYQITTDDGRTPVWTRDGRQLIYHNQTTNRLVAVDVRTGPSFTFSRPTSLPIQGTEHPISQRNYDILPDGQRFVVVLPAGSSTETADRPRAQQINVVLNWFEELKTRVPNR